MKTFTVKLGEIQVEASDNDELLRKKAQAHLPEALRRLGEKAGQEAWSTMEGAFRNSPLKLESSGSEKTKFIRETASEFARGATPAEKRDIVDTIFEQLKAERDTKVAQLKQSPCT